MHRVQLTERVPQRPKSKRKDFRDKVGSDWEMLPRATFEQSNNRLIRPVCRGFSFFWPPKEHNRNYCQQIGNNWPRVKWTENTRMQHSNNAIFSTPPSLLATARKATSSLKGRSLITIAMVILKNVPLKGGRAERSEAEGVICPYFLCRQKVPKNSAHRTFS